jgi:hypothetical protein
MEEVVADNVTETLTGVLTVKFESVDVIFWSIWVVCLKIVEQTGPKQCTCASDHDPRVDLFMIFWSVLVPNSAPVHQIMIQGSICS